MDNIWEKTIQVWNNAKTVVVDQSNKIVKKVKDSIPNINEIHPQIKECFNNVSEIKRRSKHMINRIQVIRMNLISESNCLLEVQKNCLKDSNETKQNLEYFIEYDRKIKLLSDDYIPKYVENPFELVLLKIKENTNLFKLASDSVDKIIKLKTIQKTSLTSNLQKKEELNKEIEESLNELESIYQNLLPTVREIQNIYQESMKNSYKALIFYIDEYIETTNILFAKINFKNL